jgi:hypothetical protein
MADRHICSVAMRDVVVAPGVEEHITAGHPH